MHLNTRHPRAKKDSRMNQECNCMNHASILYLCELIDIGTGIEISPYHYFACACSSKLVIVIFSVFVHYSRESKMARQVATVPAPYECIYNSEEIGMMALRVNSISSI